MTKIFETAEPWVEPYEVYCFNCDTPMGMAGERPKSPPFCGHCDDADDEEWCPGCKHNQRCWDEGSSALRQEKLCPLSDPTVPALLHKSEMWGKARESDVWECSHSSTGYCTTCPAECRYANDEGYDYCPVNEMASAAADR